MKIAFQGTRLGENELNGMIMSGEIIKNFTREGWIPDYQRERLEKKAKINGIKNVYEKRKKIDEVLFHLKGKVKPGQEPGKFVLDGDIVIIDGQQRISTLAETDITDYPHPVRVLVNLPREEEIEIFQRFNGTGTALTMGDYIASYSGPMAKLVQKLMKTSRRDTTRTIPLGRNSNKNSMSAAMGTLVLFWAHCHINGKVNGIGVIPSTKALKSFLQDTSISGKDMQYAEYALKQLTDIYVKIFGTYEYKSQAYQRPFYLAFNLLLIRNFTDGKGTVNISRFKTKINAIQGTLFKQPRFKELQTAGVGNEIIQQMYDLLVKYLNFKLKTDFLPRFEEIEEAQAEVFKQQQADEKEAKHRLRVQEVQTQFAI